MESCQQPDSIQNIPVDSFVWSESQNPTEARQMSSLQIYTVSKSIKNPQILEHIKPDYGSLGEFMKNVGISKDILMHNRKKKNQLQEDAEQKRLRTTLKDKNLDRVIKLQSSSHMQKAVASKMIVENLFESKFGTTLQNFCTQNSKPQSNKHNYSSVTDLTSKLDDLMTRSKEDSMVYLNELNPDIPILTKQKNLISKKEVQIISLSQRFEKLKSLQQKYLSLKKLPVLALTSNSQMFSDTITLTNTTPTLNSLAAHIVQFNVEHIRVVKLNEVTLSYDMFSFLLDYLTDPHCYGFRELIIHKSNLGNTQKIAIRVKQFIEQTEVRKVELNQMSFSSRDFCFLCLGIGARSNFQFLGMNSNSVGEIAKKCLDVLLKFNKQTKYNLSNNPIQRQLKGKSLYSRCFI